MQKNKLILICSVVVFLLAGMTAGAQTKKNDIPVKELPSEVLETLKDYAKALSQQTLEDCAKAFTPLAGGSLVNDAGDKLMQTVPQFSLKKDFNNFKFYQPELKITRVNRSYSNGTGYGNSAIKGWVYKIWIDKKEGVNGMPAPISIMVPEGHATITTPKVISIGSL